MIDRIAEALQRLESDIQLSREIVEQHTRMASDRLDMLYRKAPTPTILTPDQAKEVGIVSDILELGIAPDTQIWTVDWKIG